MRGLKAAAEILVHDQWKDSKTGSRFRVVELGGVYRTEKEGGEGEWRQIAVRDAAYNCLRRIVQRGNGRGWRARFARLRARLGARRA